MEVCNGNTWSIACADIIGINEARVICRQLGFNSTYVNNAQQLLINSIETKGDLDTIPTFNEFEGCLGSEASLTECRGRFLLVGRRKRGQISILGTPCQYQAVVQCGGKY